MIRLDKYLADMGVGTRSQVKQYLKKGFVTVNNQIEKRPEQKIDIQRDSVCFQGKLIQYYEYAYYMFYKPAGCVSATCDSVHKTVLDYLKDVPYKDLFPVGRLDIDTEGLLLITNDGALSHDLLSPSKHVPKTYFAKVEGQITDEHIHLFEEGLDIGDEKLTAPAKLEIIISDTISETLITITEGRFHQVKRMFEKIGGRVLYLKRISMGNLSLDNNLSPGEYRPLTEKELELLKNR